MLVACGPDANINGWFGTDHIIWTECCPGVTGDVDHYGSDGGWDPCFGNKYKPGYGASDGCPDAGSLDAASPDAAPSSGAEGLCPDPQRMCHGVPSGWQGPWLVWSGPPDQAPECPVFGSAGVTWEGHDDLAPTECASCACAESTGACALSSTITAHDVMCEDLGKPHKDITFDAKAGWTGECDGTNPIDGKSGVRSLSASAIKAQTDGCKVVSNIPRAKGTLPTRWNTFARACAGSGWTPCNQSNASCVREVPQPFNLCIAHEGVLDCPAYAPWPEKRVFYGGVDDKRECSECTCTPPVGDACVSSLSVYNDASCGQEAMIKLPISSMSNACVDISAQGAPLDSKAATTPKYIAGQCAPVPGSPSGGTAEKTFPMTLCCISQP